MPLYTTEAIVLRGYKLGEADRIVVFLTRDRGKKRGVAKGARRTRSRFAGALEPMTRIGVTYFEKESRELVSLNYAEPIRSPLSATSPDALGYVGYFAELIDAFAPDADPNEKLYRLGAATVEALVAGAPTDRVVRYFEYWALRLQGLYPSTIACQRCGAALAGAGGWLDRQAAVLLCASCGDPHAEPDLSPRTLVFLRDAGVLPPERLGEVACTPATTRELERVHRALFTTHLEREPRSSRVLRELEAHGAGRAIHSETT